MGKKFLGLGGTDHFWDRAKAWILNQITSAVAAKIAEVVANAPEDLDTLKEIADWISAHADDAAAMNTQITENKNNIATNTSDISALKTSVAGKADKVHTHTKSEITDFPTSLKNPNALTVNGKTYDGSSAVDAGVQAVENGGTGVTTAQAAADLFIGSLPAGDGVPVDTDFFISQEVNGGPFVPAYQRRPISKLWEYIKGKISSVLGLTKDNYGGKSAKSSFLDEYVGAGGTRLTSGNIVPKDASEYGGMRKDVVTSSMTDSGRPGQDGHLLTMFWDNSGRWDSQFFVPNESLQTVKVRTKANGADYGPWVDIATSAYARIPIGAPSQLEDGCIWIER